MPLLKDGQLVEDRWRFLGEDESATDGIPIAVTLERWNRDHNVLASRPGPLGIKLKAGQHPEAIAEDVDRFELIALEFPKFTDGRAYSYARRLREQLGYEGELRAVGHVLRDQLLFMHRCGFNAFEIARPDAVEAWQAALAEIGLWYQPAKDGRPTIAALRKRVLARNPSAG